MNDLFRFVLLRPASPAGADDVRVLTARFVPPGTTHDVARREARAFVDSGAHATSADGMVYSKVALEVVSRLRTKPAPAAEISSILQSATGETAVKVVAEPKFGEEEALLADSLVAMKLLSDSSGGDAAGLAVVAQGYDAIRLAAAGQDPVVLRVLSIGDFPAASRGDANPSGSPTSSPPAADVTSAAKLLADLDNAIAVLGRAPASGFEAASPPASTDTRPRTRRVATPVGPEGGTIVAPSPKVPAGTASGQGIRPWVMSAGTVSALPPTVRNTLSAHGLDLSTQPLTTVLEMLHATRVEQQIALEQTVIPYSSLISMFGNAADTVAPDDYVGDPTHALPSGHGSVRPTGIGDLLMVKQHVLRYEGGDLAHVENVLKSEHLSRETRRLERTETSVLQETESTKEETRDTQTTDRFSLKRETSDTIKTDSSIKAGVSVDAKYGPFVEVKANADFATSVSTDSSVKQASEFSKDVVERSASKLVERILERRSVTTLTQFEETYSHGFDNTAGAGHISGYYQWIDKVLQAQVYNYGKRLLFDVTVPEPGTNFILSQTHAKDVAQALEKPPTFTATAADIDEGNYRIWAKRYDATGLEPPPPPVKTVVKVVDGVFSQDFHESSKSDVLAIDEGYRAKYVSFVKDAWITESDAQWRVFVGSAVFDAITADQYRDMAGEINSVGFAYDAHNVNVLSLSIEIFCERTERAFGAWQLKVHAAITQAYLAKKQAYEQALAQAQAAAGTVIAGRNPEFNQRLVANELRKQCLTLITGQQFDAFGALELSAEGYAQPNFSRSADQMPYVRFFEQAFEWEHVVYFFYPYFWGWKKGWKNRMLLDDTDPLFGDFLRAGAARVVFPVRPGFEASVVHYLETGEIWNGGPPPDIASSLYVPIIKEIQEATGAPGSEQPVGDPWEVHLPTTLVRIRPNNDLPTWQKVGENWQPTN
jgi:hypothetical protein